MGNAVMQWAARGVAGILGLGVVLGFLAAIGSGWWPMAGWYADGIRWAWRWLLSMF